MYYDNDIYSALFILSQRQTFALHQMLGACCSSDVEKKNAYRTKISISPQKQLAELKRKAEGNLCSVYSFLNVTLKPQ